VRVNEGEGRVTIDLAIDPATGDLAFDDLGELVLVDGADAVAQEIQTRLRWWRGEWFLDTSRGAPYLESILVKGVTEATVRAILKGEIEAVPGVARVRSMVVSIDRATRYATITSLEVDTTEGDAVSLSELLVGG
jgi:hypothetical protein